VGFKFLDIKMPPGFSENDLKEEVFRNIRTRDFTCFIENQSLDARNKNNIYWQMRLGVSSESIRETVITEDTSLIIPYKKRARKVLVTGCGPSGFFSAYTLLLAGFDVTIVEQGSTAEIRNKDIIRFEKSGTLNESSNYAFGEGGAGTFSDGKLTSRTKTISKEKRFIFDTYVTAGAPAEIAYLSKPHLGSDNLMKMVIQLRKMFEDKGGKVCFETEVTGIRIKGNKINALETSKGIMDADYFVFATGHSAYKTYKMLIRSGVPFETKPFAIGTRAEHRQDMINLSQWGKPSLPGVSPSEYKLTFNAAGSLPVYSFCMCPGGRVVQATPYHGLSIVNGMSRYRRDTPFANAGIVAAVHPDRLANKKLDALGAIEVLNMLERKFYDFSDSYASPACYISSFLRGKSGPLPSQTSYPLGLVSADFKELLPEEVYHSIRTALKDFCHKIRGFESGVILGLESKTSSPVRAIRDQTGKSHAFENLYVTGEGSGFAGGIVSSAADGIKAALNIIRG